jgi:3-hydroxy-D-aspartate aldolase
LPEAKDVARSRLDLLEHWLNDLRGVGLEQLPTPALLIDHDAMIRNIAKLAGYASSQDVRLRAHAKTHKSVDIARIQMNYGACGICCQKVSEAEAMVEGGIKDILVSNQVVGEAKIRRLAELARRARIIVCVDDGDNVDRLSRAATVAGSTIECLVEIDVGSARCGVTPGEQALRLAAHVAERTGLVFAGIQAYHGAAQHVRLHADRKERIEEACALAAGTVLLLRKSGLSCGIVGGAGTGTFQFEAASGVFNELQCGSYVFMDADYQKVLGENGEGIGDFENSLFVVTEIMSKVRSGNAVCDAGVKAHSIDSGVPRVHGRADLTVTRCSDEHAVIVDPHDTLVPGEKLLLVPGHCDPTCNLYDNYIVMRAGKVSDIWPVSARGLLM